MNLKSSFLTLKQNPIALAIFVLGILAFLFVCFWAIKIISHENKPSDSIEISQQDIDDLRKNTQVDVIKEEKQPAYKRQKKIKEKEIIGAWDTQLGNARALLQLQEGTFRLIVIDRGGLNTRYYINGTYDLLEDVLVLDPDVRSPSPSTKYNYQILTRATLPVAVSKHKGKMIWQIPDDDVDIYVPNNHAVLDRVSNKIAVWSVLK